MFIQNESFPPQKTRGHLDLVIHNQGKLALSAPASIPAVT
jgi:hypothetical protein